MLKRQDNLLINVPNILNFIPNGSIVYIINCIVIFCFVLLCYFAVQKRLSPEIQQAQEYCQRKPSTLLTHKLSLLTILMMINIM